jgi:hypothetical protein
MGSLSKKIRIICGAAMWLCGLSAAWWYLTGCGSEAIVQPELITSLTNYATGTRRVAELEFEAPCGVRIGDPIFVVDGPESVRQVGEITAVPRAGRSEAVEALFYTSAPEITSQSELTYHVTPSSMDWVLRTMLPEEKRRKVAAELKRSFDQHSEEVVGLLRPIAEDAVRDAFSVVEADLTVALRKRNAELERLAGRYQRELVERELVPMVRREIWPVVVKHAQPEMDRVGREIWDRASLWRFGWRYAYDVTPLPQKDLAKGEWQRFVAQEAVPVLENHKEQFMQIQERVFREVARNPEVQAAVRRSVTKVISNPDVQHIATEVIQEVVLYNPRLRSVLERHWQSDRTQRALEITSARLEPTAVRIGELLLGTPDGGVTPEFARVLRNQILFKDQRWLVLKNETGERPTADTGQSLTLRVAQGPPDALNPFVRGLRNRGHDAPNS